MNRVLTSDRVIARLEKSYAGFEESVVQGESGPECIVINAEAGLEDRNGNSIFDYWSDSGVYEIGVVAHLNRWANRNGWWFQWVNPGCIKMYPLD